MFDLRGLIAQPGPNQVAYEDPANPGRLVTLYSARPRDVTPETPLVIAHHGAGRNGDGYRDYWTPFAMDQKVLVVVPGLAKAAFPGSVWYNRGGVTDDQGRPRPRDSWVYGLDGRLFQQLREQGVTRAAKYGLWGHSAGGQFVHRAISLGFTEHVAGAIAANPGSYAMPSLSIGFPYGLGGVGLDSAGLAAALRAPLTIMTGTDDVDTTSADFPKEAPAMAQGATRHARAHSYYDAGQMAATAMGVRCAWSIIDVPGVGHDGKRMAAAAGPVMARLLRG